MRNALLFNNNPYQQIYDALGEVREIFHREGRLNDSNEKLDETVKFLAVHYAAHKGIVQRSKFQALCEKNTFSVEALQSLFLKVAETAPFFSEECGSMFGGRPHIGFEPGDENVAYELFRASGYALVAQNNSETPLDVLNEAFGHHVRDNFRNHIEDAQYMTPPEVVEFMVNCASKLVLDNRTPSGNEPFIMMDPTCGVGSFVAAWRTMYDRTRQMRSALPPLHAVGQDKVERMVRLATMNLILSGTTSDLVYSGNSLSDGSPLDQYNGRVDLILTNPPFGAKFPLEEVKAKGRLSTPFFASSTLATKSFDSELLFVDRYLSLLREGGVCLAIVPDSVISAKGLPAYLRQHLCRNAVVRGVVELPPVAFAQAGTRTKTAVLVFEKKCSPRRKVKVFFGEAHDLGFEVSKRKGVPIKRLEGHNQLPDVLAAYMAEKDCPADSKGRHMTAIWRTIEPLRHEAWTPRQFKVDSERVQEQVRGNRFTLCNLGDLVERIPRRRSEHYSVGKLFISVLHVISEGVLDIAGVNSHAPITPGFPVHPGEVIISRINPRIPRVLVVPDLGKPLLCSSEFEILRPRKGISPYALAYMLMSSLVQEQIQALTAGTSASHSRVKPEKLYEIQIPWPVQKHKSEFGLVMSQYGASMKSLVKSIASIHSMRQAEHQFLCSTEDEA